MSAENKTRKKHNRWLVLIVLCICESMYLLPYLRWTFYDTMVEGFMFTNTEMATLGSIFGVIGMVGYIFGGPISDRFSPRKILVTAFLSTAICGFWFAAYPPFWACVIIHIVWGIATSLLLWDCMMRQTRSLGTSEEQGRLFGLLEGGRGAVDTVASFAMVAMFAALGSTVGSLRSVIIALSFVCIIGALLVWIFIGDEIPGADESEKIKVADLKEVIKNPAVWLIALVILANYSIYTGGTYLTPYLTEIVGISAAAAAVVAVFRNFVFMMLGGPIGGFLADKSSITKTMLVTGIFLVIGMVAFVLLPASAAAGVSITMMLLVYLCLFFQRGIYFGTVDQAGIPMRITGTAVGVISFVGFIPEVYMNSLSGYLLDAFPGELGYHYLFIAMLAFAVLGLVVVFLLHRRIQRTSAQEQPVDEVAA